MSATSTPSISSQYYDALVMQFSLPTGNGNAEVSGSSANPSRAAGPLNQNGSSQPPRTTGEDSPPSHADDGSEQNAPSLRSLPTEPRGQEQYVSGMRSTFGSVLARKHSVRTTRSTHSTATASAFANGAPITGPDAEPYVDENLFVRGDNAERLLNQEQKDRIAKEEKKESKKFSRILKTESSNEKVALDSALKNLAALQGLHKDAIKREAKADASHAKALSAAQKAESRFQEEKARAAEMRARSETRCMEERARWEGKEGELRAQQERLESAREHVRDTEARIADCAREVERLRIVKAMDEREREAKFTELVGGRR